LTTQFPWVLKETTPPLMEQTEAADRSMENSTGRPEEAVAVGV
jgi:hypothetical protein